jgi:hypothetical protein
VPVVIWNKEYCFGNSNEEFYVQSNFVIKHVHCISCSFLSWQCVQAAYDKLCLLSPSCGIHIKGLLAYLPSLWINGSTEECTKTVRSVKNILEALRIDNVSYRKYFEENYLL